MAISFDVRPALSATLMQGLIYIVKL